MKSQSKQAAKAAMGAGYERVDVLASTIGASTVTIAKWCRSGAVPGMRIGAAWWGHKDSVIAKAEKSAMLRRASARAANPTPTAAAASVVSLDVVEAMLRAIVAEAVAEIRSLFED